MRPLTFLDRLAALACLLLPGVAMAGPWTLGAGTLALKEGLGFWTTERKFASSLDRQLTFSDRGAVDSGDRIPFDPSTGGRLTTAGLETQVQLGVLEWLDVGVSVPLLFMNFDTDPIDTVDARFGLGDVVVSVHAMLPVELPLAFAARLEAKLPTGDFDPSVFAAPLTEGQLDVTGWASTGASLPYESWASFDAGYRLRFENPANNADPGEELLLVAELGSRLVSGLFGKVALDGLFGRAGVIDRFGASTTLPRRRVFSLWLASWWAVDDSFALEMSARWLFAGEDYPAGVQVFAGVRATVQLFGDGG